MELLDLAVDQISCVSAGDKNWQVNYELHNLGTKNASFLTNVYLSKDAILDKADRLVADRKDFLAPGDSEEVNLLVNSRGRQSFNYILVQADSRNRYQEVDELNNFASSTLPLVGADLTISQAEVHVGRSTFNVGFTIKNLGGQKSPDYSVQVQIDGRPASNWSLKGLEAGKQYSLMNIFRWPRLLIGSHEVEIIVDRKNLIAETNELNNSLFGTKSLTRSGL